MQACACAFPRTGERAPVWLWGPCVQHTPCSAGGSAIREGRSCVAPSLTSQGAGGATCSWDTVCTSSCSSPPAAVQRPAPSALCALCALRRRCGCGLRSNSIRMCTVWAVSTHAALVTGCGTTGYSGYSGCDGTVATGGLLTSSILRTRTVGLGSRLACTACDRTGTLLLCSTGLATGRL